ncbi:MAG: hypothetical protein ACXAD7_03685 [Candidatus Kariarchaeaceae archaeon]
MEIEFSDNKKVKFVNLFDFKELHGKLLKIPTHLLFGTPFDSKIITARENKIGTYELSTKADIKKINGKTLKKIQTDTNPQSIMILEIANGIWAQKSYQSPVYLAFNQVFPHNNFSVSTLIAYSAESPLHFGEILNIIGMMCSNPLGVERSVKHTFDHEVGIKEAWT